jgi:CheY-like chemotaxis protein
MEKGKLLWIDDEIELLKSHIIFLSEKGYEVDTVTNGEDALSEIKRKNYDLVFLDEMMPGLGGLETLAKIKEINPNVPVVMITKSEEESLMNDAIGSQITDYLIKPILPSQVLLVCKKILESKQISGEYVAKDYLSDFNKISQSLMMVSDYQDWVDIYLKLVNWDLEFDNHPDLGLRQSLNDQRKECNAEFGKFVEKNYLEWINSPGDYNSPVMSPQVLDEFVIPEIVDAKGPVFLFVLDCLRLDQWLVMEKHLTNLFEIQKDYYISILPTATPYARNAIFSGMFPSEIQNEYPELWQGGNDDERSQNKFEKEFLARHLEKRKVKLKTDLKYMKIIDPEVGKGFQQNIRSHSRTHFMAVVVNTLDMIAHGRSDSDILKEIAPDEPAYRSLTNSWFKHSSLLGMFKIISEMKNATVIITTDHGSIRALRGAKVLGDKEASKSLRFKFGRNLKVDDKHAMFIRKPEEYKLPARGAAVGYIIAKEDFYFVYPTEYHKYLSIYKDTFQHGGISMEEMILPVIKMKSKA